MTAVARMWRRIWKELRALLPIWAGAVFALAVAMLVRDNRMLTIAGGAYIVGMLALGAHSIGHEYTYRMLGAALSQPEDRRAILLLKLTALIPLMLSLTVLSGFARVPASPFRTADAWWMLVLPSLTLTPWLTMISRNTLAGALLTGNVVGITHIIYYTQRIYHLEPFAERRTMTVTLCAIAAVLGWRTFMRLEAIEGPGTDLHLPQWLRIVQQPGRRTALWSLVLKELRLQQLTFATLLFYVVMWTALTLVNQQLPAGQKAPIEAVTLMYLLLLAVVIGSLASAEERRGGTLEWQMLLPMPAWRQWMVKTAVAVLLALTLGVLIPQLLFGVRGVAPVPTVVLVVVLTTFSLYLSSLCGSGVWAMALWVPVVTGASLLFRAVQRAAELLMPMAYPTLVLTPWFISAAGFAALFIYFGFWNHRFVDRSAGRVAQQAAVFAAFLAVSVVLVMRW